MAKDRATLWIRLCSTSNICRTAAVVMFLLGMALSYLDAQTMAERHVTLNSPIPQPVEMERTKTDGGLAQEVKLLARVPTRAPLTVTVRRGLLLEDFAVIPMAPTVGDADSRAAGFAVIPAGAADALAKLVPDADGLVTFHGLIGVPEALVGPAREALRQAGMPIAQDALEMSLFTGPRQASLARSIRNDWRSVFFWMTACFLVAAYIFQGEKRRIDAARARAALEGTNTRAVAPKRAPRTEKARTRFVPLAETAESAAPQVEVDGFFRGSLLVRWLGSAGTAFRNRP